MKIDFYSLFFMIILALFCLVVLLGCKSKESTIERTYVSDTLRTASLTYKTKPIQSNYTINLECDTITGKVKDVNFSEKSGDNSARLVIENNQLKALLDVAETESKTDTIYKTRYKDVYKNKDVVKFRTPFWHWWAHIFLLVILFLYLKRFFS